MIGPHGEPSHDWFFRRGKGVRLQKYKDGGMSDAITFSRENGLSWQDPAGRTRTEADLTEWTGKRATAGHRPHGVRHSHAAHEVG